MNRFVAYHFVKGRMAYNRLVHHRNEYNYRPGDFSQPQTVSCPTNVWDYYPTVGARRGLLKVTQVGDAGFERDLDHSVYLNRVSAYANGRDEDYHEVAAAAPGIRVLPTNGRFDNNAQNGFYYPIDGILAYDAETRRRLGGERIRIDLASFLHELSSNNVRATTWYYFPKGYFEDFINQSNGTQIYYVVDTGGASWRVLQGDEMELTGIFDGTFRLPPVPQDGTYELRLGISLNPLRGMGQFYFGTDPQRLAPVGLPIDMRQSVEDNPAIPWVGDGDDEQVNIENDKNLRNQGFMKAPNYFTVTNGAGDTPVRGVRAQPALRAILTVADMDADQTYYLRMKSALKKTDTQFSLDFIEYVPTSVYNGVQPEDIW